MQPIYGRKCFETVLRFVPFFLGHGSVDANRWEILFNQQLGKSYASWNGLDENDDLGLLMKGPVFDMIIPTSLKRKTIADAPA